MASRLSQMRNELNNQSQQLNDPYIDQIKTLMNSGGDPTQLLAQAAMMNPQFQQVLQLLQNGGNPQVIFENLARQKGIDPNWLLNKLMN